MLDEIKFNRIKEEAVIHYKTLDEIYCPYFKEKIAFNHKGLEHIEYKKRNMKRLILDQYKRFKLLKYAPYIVSQSATLQGKRNTKNFEFVKINSRWEYVLRDVIYYEFIAIVDNYRIRIVLKRIEDGTPFFWSIIPYWKIDKETSDRLFYSGIPEED